MTKTNARLLFGSCLRSETGSSFAINFETPQFEYANQTKENFNLGMNQQIEDMIIKTPQQYLWTYKRFKRQPSGSELYLDERRSREKKERRALSK